MAVSTASSPLSTRSAASARVVRRRHYELPHTRSIIGASLIVIAMLGIFLTYSKASNQPSTLIVTASHDIAIGTKLTAADLGAVPIQSSQYVKANHAFTNKSALLGAITSAQIAKGEVIQTSAVEKLGAGMTRKSISLSLDSAHALNGAIRPGDTVDVLVTTGGDTTAQTQIVLPNARVLSVDNKKTNIGSDASMMVGLGIPDDPTEIAVTNAINSGKVTLVRTVGGTK